MLPEVYQEIAEATNMETAKAIAELFAGCQVYFPLWDRDGSLRRRNESICRDRRAGMDLKDLARKYGLTERHIRGIVEECERRK